MRYSKFLLLIFIFSGLFLLVISAKAQPSAITDLRCVFSDMPGAVWLTWTPPAGTNSYEVRYALSPINEPNYNLTYRFSQGWSGTASRGLVTNLTENRTWFFVMKAIDVGNNYSAISNVIYCSVPKIEVPKDDIAPTSSIDEPKEGETILAGKDYIIKGTSSDTGGSSVQKVEISLDNGKTWFLTKPKESVSTGFNWEYVWEKPIAGTYTLKTRATDWWENQEIPGDGIKIIVSELETEKPEVEKPISEMTIEELKAKIIEVQQKIVQLLTQLIQLIQQQIADIRV